MTVARTRATRGPTSLLEEARLTGEFADWHNLLYEVAWLTGRLDVAAVRDAWWRVCLRHDVMRRTYVSADEACTYDDALSEVEFHTAGTDAEAIEIMRRVLGTPFDLYGPGFSRIVVVQRDERRHLLGIAVDHVISDGMSWFLLSRDFAETYGRALAGDAADPAERGTYRSFAAQQRSDFAGAWGRKRRAFWRSYTADFGMLPPPFPVGGRREGEPSSTVVGRALPPDARAKVHELSLRAGATPFAVVASGMLAAMHEVTGEPVVGLTTNHHGRMLPGTSRTLGLFTQTVPLHLRKEKGTPLETIRDVFLRSLDVAEHILPLRVAGSAWSEDLLSPDREAGVFVALADETPSDSGLPLAGIVVEKVELEFPGAKRAPETVVVSWNLDDAGPQLVAHYNDEVFPDATVEHLLGAARDFVFPDEACAGAG